MGTPVEFWTLSEIESVLCGLRVSQMTRTYEDLDAITQLLEEKQTDLELAAKIGKNLLERNRNLESKLLETEKLLNTHEETIRQLNHDISIKNNLLCFYTKDPDQLTDLSDNQPNILSENCLSTSQTNLIDLDNVDNFSLSSVNFAHLNRKLRELEEENIVLRQERNRLSSTADQLDDHETVLVRDCARQLVLANMHIRTLSDELAKKSDAFMNQQSEITRLLTRGIDLENRVKQLVAENEMLSSRLKETQLSQSLLTSELKTLRDKYDECITLYNEARSEIRTLRKRSRRAYLRPGTFISSGNSLLNSPICPASSSAGMTSVLTTDPYLLDQEIGSSSSYRINQSNIPSDDSTSSLDVIETQSMNPDHSENSLAMDLAQAVKKDIIEDNVKSLFRAMDQARCVRVSARDPEGSIGLESGVEDTISSSGFVSGSEPSENIRKKSEQFTQSTTPSTATTPTVITSNKDIQSRTPYLQYKNLNPMDNKYIAQRVKYGPTNPVHRDLQMECEKRHSWLGCHDTKFGNKYDFNLLQNVYDEHQYSNCFDDSVLPEPLLSSDPTTLSVQSYSKFPQRLQLIKPLDGSNVLQQWQHLATPSFTRALFEAPLPGVQSRAGIKTSIVSKEMQIPKQEEFETVRNQRSGSVEYSPFHFSIFEKEGVQLSNKRDSHCPDRSSLARFGCDLNSHLLNEDLRSRSLDFLLPSLNPTITSCDLEFPQRNHLETQNKSHKESDSTIRTPFSITSLVSALLPFSTTTKPLTGEVDSKNLNSINPKTCDSVRIRPRSPSGPRGLLDVNRIDTDSTLIHRATASTPNTIGRTSPSLSSTSNVQMTIPNSQPPTMLCPNVNRPVSYSRPIHTTNLTEITEESGSPPKSSSNDNTQTSKIDPTNLTSQPALSI